MIDLSPRLPFWLNGDQAKKAALSAQAFWAEVETWLLQSVAQVDIRTCSSKALAYHADTRGIVRLPGESEALFRQRVRHAVTTAIESGSRSGLEFILSVYGVVGFDVQERVPGLDWDVVQITLSPDALSVDSDLLDKILHRWGRVCRRYVVTHVVTSPLRIQPVAWQEVQYTGVAS